MISLLEKMASGEMQEEEILDIALSLCSFIEGEGCGCVLNPENILLDDDNKVHLREQTGKNLLFAAPEVFLEGRENDKNAQWFSLGLLLDYMKNKQDYYTRRDTPALMLLKNYKDKTYIIEAGDDSPAIMTIAKKLSAVSPENRIEGVKELIGYLNTIKGKVRIELICNNNCVGIVNMEIDRDIEQYPANSRLKGSDGKFYHAVSSIMIPYRPGFHTYQLHVQRAAAEEIPEEEWWLYVFNSYRKALMPIVKISGAQGVRQNFPITNKNVAEWHFYIVKRDNDSKKAQIQSEFTLDFSEHLSKPRLFLSVTSDVNKRTLRMELYDGIHTENLFENPIEVVY